MARLLSHFLSFSLSLSVSFILPFVFIVQTRDLKLQHSSFKKLAFLEPSFNDDSFRILFYVLFVEYGYPLDNVLAHLFRFSFLFFLFLFLFFIFLSFPVVPSTFLFFKPPFFSVHQFLDILRAEFTLARCHRRHTFTHARMLTFLNFLVGNKIHRTAKLQQQ